MPRDFTFIPRWSPCPELHNEQDPRIERFIKLAARMLINDTETNTLNELIEKGALPNEAVNAIRAANILNEAADADERKMPTVPRMRARRGL